VSGPTLVCWHAVSACPPHHPAHADGKAILTSFRHTTDERASERVDNNFIRLIPTTEFAY